MTPYLQFRSNFEQWLRVHVSRTMQLPEPTIAKTNDWWVVSNLAFVRIGLVCGFVRWSVGHLKNWITARSWPFVVKKFNCRFSENGTIIENAIMRYRWAKAKIGNGYVALMECFDIFAREEVGSYESGNQIEVGSYDTVSNPNAFLALFVFPPFAPAMVCCCYQLLCLMINWKVFSLYYPTTCSLMIRQDYSNSSGSAVFQDVITCEASDRINNQSIKPNPQSTKLALNIFTLLQMGQDQEMLKKIESELSINFKLWLNKNASENLSIWRICILLKKNRPHCWRK